MPTEVPTNAPTDAPTASPTPLPTLSPAKLQAGVAAAVAAAKEEGTPLDYVIGSVRSNKCREGGVAINETAICQRVAEQMGATWIASGFFEDDPKGCEFDQLEGTMTFNLHPNGTGSPTAVTVCLVPPGWSERLGNVEVTYHVVPPAGADVGNEIKDLDASSTDDLSMKIAAVYRRKSSAQKGDDSGASVAIRVIEASNGLVSSAQPVDALAGKSLPFQSTATGSDSEDDEQTVTVVEFILENVAFDLLSDGAKEDLQKLVAVQYSVVADVDRNRIQVMLLPGSVKVEAIIPVPVGTTIRDQLAKLRGPAGKDAAQQVAKDMELSSNMKAACTGPVTVEHLVTAPEEAPPSALGKAAELKGASTSVGEKAAGKARLVFILLGFVGAVVVVGSTLGAAVMFGSGSLLEGTSARLSDGASDSKLAADDSDSDDDVAAMDLPDPNVALLNAELMDAMQLDPEGAQPDEVQPEEAPAEVSQPEASQPEGAQPDAAPQDVEVAASAEHGGAGTKEAADSADAVAAPLDAAAAVTGEGDADDGPPVSS